MPRWTVALVLALALAFSLQAAEWVPLTSSIPGPPRVTVLSDAPGETVFRVDVPGYFLDEVSVDGVLHTRMLLAKSPRLLRVGEPELPFVAVSIAIPGAGIPMATLSGRHAAEAIMQDRALISRSARTAMPGGMSTASPTTGATPSRSSPS